MIDPQASPLQPGITHPSSRACRTRFAPSPTGDLHLGGARTALFAWAFAKHFGGQFVLRIEDTDLERSTASATQGILDGMAWLGLDYNEGPFYQSQRMDRYRDVLEVLVKEGYAYRCYCTPAELDAMRDAQRAAQLKPRYDGRWRPAPGKTLPPPPAGVQPVIRFCNPEAGSVAWQDMVKGDIEISNTELDDLIIARGDGSPTYNFCVVVDDLDMRITHVIRGDDHINNTPRQINILNVLLALIAAGKLHCVDPATGQIDQAPAQTPVYGHVPMILGPDGEKLSKRHGAVSVMAYATEGLLPEAMVNYLARLGWSHGDDELFTREDLINWFDGGHLSKSASQFDPEKLRWVNAHYLRQRTGAQLLADIQTAIAQGHISEALPVDLDTEPFSELLFLLKERSHTLVDLLEAANVLWPDPVQVAEQLPAHLSSDDIRQGLLSFYLSIKNLSASAWQATELQQRLKSVLSEKKLKMPALAMPIRVMVCGRTQTPGIDQLLAILGPDRVLPRLHAGLLLAGFSANELDQAPPTS